MRTASTNNHRGLARIAAAGLALVVGLSFFAPAAGAQDSLDGILKDLAGYKFDQGVGSPLALRAYVFAHKDDPAERKACEAKLLAFLQAQPAPGGVMAACRALRLIGGPASVPVLEAMLLKSETTDPARYAIERIPGAEADAALLAALGKTKGDVRRGIVSSIGERATGAAVPALEKLVNGKDPTVSGDAVKALGKIGTADAAHALTAYLGAARGTAKGEAASALLACAAAFRRAGKTAEAGAIYEKLVASDLPDIDRQAAFRMKLHMADESGQALILKALAGKDAVLYAPAVSMVPMAFKGETIGQILPLADKLPEDAQIQLTAVLAGYPADTVLPAVMKAAEGPRVGVRMEAVRTIGKIGNPSVVGLLARRAASTVGDEQSLARETLVRLRGSDVETAILDGLRNESDVKVKAELAGAAGERRIAAAKPILMDLVRNGAPELHLKAVRALEDVSTAADLRDLLALLFATSDESAREALLDTVSSVAQTISRPLARGDAAENLLAAEKDPKKRADLLRVLGKIGDDTALPLVRKALADPDKDVADAAVRALADWPDIQAREDVLAVAGQTTNLTHKVLALRAYVRMIGLEPYLRPESAVAGLEKVLALSDRPDEKKLVLGALPKFPCPQALKVAEMLAADPSVAAEAKLAVDRIRRSLGTR